MAQPVRIQKYLSEINLCSRREAERWLSEGRIKINGVVVTEPGTTIHPGVDDLSIEEPSKAKPVYSYICVYKPAGVVTNLPVKGEKELRDLLPKSLSGLRPIGLLDKYSEGVVLMTDDRHFSAAVLDAQNQREYVVFLKNEITSDVESKLEAELMPPGSRVQRSDYEWRDEMELVIRMNDGKNRQMHKLLSRVGIPVVGLIRTRYGSVSLAKLSVGGYRALTPAEMSGLRKPATGRRRRR